MKVTGTACDVCERFSPDADTPPDWFGVVRGGNLAEVCSPACLCKLGRQLKQLDAGPQPGESFPCDECDRKFKTKQGLGSHKTKSHGEE